MKRVYVAHSRSFDFSQELYKPLRESQLSGCYEFIFPHETDQFVDSREIIRTSHFVIAEVSFPATGEGIELGWASSFNVPILCLYREGVKPSGSLKAVTKNIVSYSDLDDMVRRIEHFLSGESSVVS